MKDKVYKIATLEELGDIINEDNFADLTECLLQCLLMHVEVKMKNDSLKLKAMNWKDDGNNNITKVNLSVG